MGIRGDIYCNKTTLTIFAVQQSCDYIYLKHFDAIQMGHDVLCMLIFGSGGMCKCLGKDEKRKGLRWEVVYGVRERFCAGKVVGCKNMGWCVKDIQLLMRGLVKTMSIAFVGACEK